MNYWWVNHKKTFRLENEGGFIWSPQENLGGGRNQTYINLTLAQVGDIVYSYADGEIKSIGCVVEEYVPCGPPEVFQDKSDAPRLSIGWIVQVRWTNLSKKFVPVLYLNEIVPLLPIKYSPIKPNGYGNQGVYLAAISEELGEKLISLIGQNDAGAVSELFDTRSEVEEVKSVRQIEQSELSFTERAALIQARVGQGIYRKGVLKIEKQCRLSGTTDNRFLVASHIKPWSKSSNLEKLDPHNGLMLAPHVDKLFDKGYISFSDDGDLLTAGAQIELQLKQWNLPIGSNVGVFTTAQKIYLEYHREYLFAKQFELFSNATTSLTSLN